MRKLNRKQVRRLIKEAIAPTRPEDVSAYALSRAASQALRGAEGPIRDLVNSVDMIDDDELNAGVDMLIEAVTIIRERLREV